MGNRFLSDACEHIRPLPTWNPGEGSFVDACGNDSRGKWERVWTSTLSLQPAANHFLPRKPFSRVWKRSGEVSFSSRHIKEIADNRWLTLWNFRGSRPPARTKGRCIISKLGPLRAALYTTEGRISWIFKGWRDQYPKRHISAEFSEG